MIRIDDTPGRLAWRRLAVAAMLVAVAMSAAPPGRSAAPRLPPLMLWAWERPTDLRELPEATGVAFLAQTIHLGRDGIAIAPRRQKLLVAPATSLLAVTRIESSPGELEHVLVHEISTLAGRIAGTAALPRVRGVQIDFDATRSQRVFYRRLLHEVRQKIGPDGFVSITALASWCQRDGWLDGLPVDEVVPMLFRMGEGERMPDRIRGSTCQGALGLALDEPLPAAFRAPRLYVFNAGPWTPSTVADARQRRGR